MSDIKTLKKKTNILKFKVNKNGVKRMLNKPFFRFERPVIIHCGVGLGWRVRRFWLCRIKTYLDPHKAL